MNARLPGRWDGGGLAVGTGRTGLRRARRGASLPASPSSFVAGHHVPRTQRTSGEPDVVLHSPLALIPSSGGTTSLGPSGPPAMRTWCFTPRNPFFLRRRAPRLSGPAGLRRARRGASLPASPSSFVGGHHVARPQRSSGEPDVVLHFPQALLPSSGGTTSTRSGGHRVPTLKTKPEGNSRPRISLPLTVGGNFPLSPRHRARSVPPQSESTSCPHPLRKCSPFQIRKPIQSAPD